MDTAFLRQELRLPALADEALGPDGEALRVVYGLSFHPLVAVTVRRVGDLAELEVRVEGAAPERAMIDPAAVAPLLALLAHPIDAWDFHCRDGIAAHGERWDGRTRIVADIGNPTRETEPAACRLLEQTLEFAAAHPWSEPTRAALATLHNHLTPEPDPVPKPPRRARTRRR